MWLYWSPIHQPINAFPSGNSGLCGCPTPQIFKQWLSSSVCRAAAVIGYTGLPLCHFSYYPVSAVPLRIHNNPPTPLVLLTSIDERIIFPMVDWKTWQLCLWPPRSSRWNQWKQPFDRTVLWLWQAWRHKIHFQHPVDEVCFWWDREQGRVCC